ncbi:hypothetical protein VOLCADRAFT_107128 [Volvox carteri f. nagariensis]|uniref:Glycosyltransferase n=1 Tax=Volvox carteri f. nagariensis TaxID=3068 RepID=D8UC36_VOLCA|nr:uncharacterized protein VOLCADRAFT_107128 [Volvox carteri f. nagariensis]EFJ42727.1 hypothetical protein VOLCADRAFT_107128 [Volvox carteri f. nagariensis]|eukprot:XP_002956188.1 hypothetical protein VOLCADRAFT_107128 [Volvox carteri f. nagariensis]
MMDKALAQCLLLITITFTASAAAAGAAAEDSVFGSRDLKTVLERIAINKEVMAAVSNGALITPNGKYGMLKLWIDGCQRAGVKNFMVIAIDDDVANACENLGVAYWRKTPEKTADKEASNHGISAQKFQLIREFLSLGYSVLLSDVDIVTLQNPFDHLYRDEDVEALSDGYDEQTAYGWDDVHDDPKMGWSRWAHTIRVFTLNSGLFYIRPNERTIGLMDRITDRLNKRKEWDQAVFNMEIWFPSHDDYKTSRIAVRIMNIDKFMNSKRLFKTIRYDAQYSNHVPVMVHVNYHPDKFQRMQSIWARRIAGLQHYKRNGCRQRGK